MVIPRANNDTEVHTNRATVYCTIQAKSTPNDCGVILRIRGRRNETQPAGSFLTRESETVESGTWLQRCFEHFFRSIIARNFRPPRRA